jgi:hypothetical protein
LTHPDSNYATTFTSNRGVAPNLSADKVRTDIITLLKNYAAATIQQQGPVVPEDRIAVTLL